MQYNKSLDGFRGLSVFLVFLFHADAVPFGWIGVEMFFVLSGYLITATLLDTRSLTLACYLLRFYWRRIMRIWPLYIGFLCILLASSFYVDGLDRFRSDIGYILSFTYNLQVGVTQDWQESYSHLWSLSIEEQFYTLWPIVIFVASRATMCWIMLVTIAFGPAIRLLTSQVYLAEIYPHHLPLDPEGVFPLFGSGMFVYMFSASHFDAFATGALLALLPAEIERRRWLTSPIATCAIASFVIVVGLLFAALWGTPRYDLYGNFYRLHMPYNYQFIWGYSLINLFSASLILALTQPNWLYRLFCFRPLAYLGKVSFGFYVLHMPVRQILHTYLSALDTGTLTFNGVWFVLSWLVAATSYHLFESFFLRRKNYWEQRHSQRTDSAAPAHTEMR